MNTHVILNKLRLSDNTNKQTQIAHLIIKNVCSDFRTSERDKNLVNELKKTRTRSSQENKMNSTITTFTCFVPVGSKTKDAVIRDKHKTT